MLKRKSADERKRAKPDRDVHVRILGFLPRAYLGKAANRIFRAIVLPHVDEVVAIQGMDASGIPLVPKRVCVRLSSADPSVHHDVWLQQGEFEVTRWRVWP